jgi:putative Mg2+ transporter-C (MgtC) family protein
MTGITSTEIVLRLVFAAAAGALVGIDREARGKPAGLRTHALVALGAALVTVCGIQYLEGSSDEAALTRVIQGVIAGVGFLGGGAILRARDRDAVTGLTTAATIWIVAALGIACGGGHWGAVTTAVVLVAIVLILGRRIDQFLRDNAGKRNGGHV